jgi:Predicted ATPase involved in replication control, Cdc46/Mcm family
MTDYILNVHTDGEKIAGGKDVDKSVYKPLLSPDFIRKYVVYARKNSFPILSPEARQKIKEYYLEKRLQSKETKTMIMTPRQLEALIRLSEASARVRLSERINEEDVNRAIRLMEYFLRDSASVNGKIDIDLVTTGHSSKERTEISIILDIIERYESQFGFAKLSDIESEAERNNISKETLERLLKVMKNNAMIYEYRNDIYKVLRSKQGA